MNTQASAELREPAIVADSLAEALRQAATLDPDSPAIYEEGCEPLRYQQLSEQIDYVRRQLGAHEITGADCVAVNLPRSADLALALLGVACTAAVAPLKSELSIDETRGHLKTLAANAILTVAGSNGEIAAVELGIPVLRILRDPDRTPGRFQFAAERQDQLPDAHGPLENEFCALFLTSGTTSQPKRVPLTCGTILARARRTIEGFRLTRDDRLLDPMPQTTAYSLVSALLPTLLTGGAAMILNEFEPVKFLRRAWEFSATWSVTAPPHLNAILLALEHQPELARDHTLRILRCGTGHLSEDVADRLEGHLGIPIAVGYGMVETGQIANSPAPPERRKPGSVGRPRMDIQVVDESGRQVEMMVPGEILVRGPQVFSGYLDDPQANEETFEDGWFRTGDLGYLDEDGFLFLVGRKKEIINRGGESIAPMEIDDALLSHPAVADAAAFSIPHRTLHEDVAAAVVLRHDFEVTERELIRHVGARLSAAKTPRRVFLLPDLPKGPSGKTSRRLLSARFSEKPAGDDPVRPQPAPGRDGKTRQKRSDLALGSMYRPAETPVEKTLASIWAEVLDLDEVGVDDDFMELGGDSLTATQIISRVHDEFERDLSVRLLFEARTISDMAQTIQQTTS